MSWYVQLGVGNLCRARSRGADARCISPHLRRALPQQCASFLPLLWLVTAFYSRRRFYFMYRN